MGFESKMGNSHLGEVEGRCIDEGHGAGSQTGLAFGIQPQLEPLGRHRVDERRLY